MEITPLTALSPIDGRYASKAGKLRDLCSEFGLIRYRTQVEVAWYVALADDPTFEALIPPGDDDRRWLDELVHSFSADDAQRIKDIEATTNHDVKAVEYFLKERFETRPRLRDTVGFLHFACTSEDINNLAYALMLRDARDLCLLPALDEISSTLAGFASGYADTPMLSRTHGQTASPTTLGKEFANVVARLRRQRDGLGRQQILGKMNGAVGNYNAHSAACPEVDWPALSERFVRGLGLDWNPFTTQIEPHDWMAEYFHELCRVHTILIDLCRDLWAYISIGYFRQKTVAGEVGSSTMPHKVNPIDFENAEGNLGVANALLEHLAGKLPVSRWQRDLTDSTVLRTIGTALGHGNVAFASLQRGLGKLEVDEARLAADLDGAWEVLAEPIQTVMRVHGMENPYEQLKALTRGRRIDRNALAAFIDGLDLPEAARSALRALEPAAYTGLAERLARGLQDPE